MNIRFILLLILLAGRIAFAADYKEQYRKVVVGFLCRDQFALQYDATLVSKDGNITPVFADNSIVVRDNLTLFTTTQLADYVINTEGSIIVNHPSKKITVNYNPYTESETADLSKNLNDQLAAKLLKVIGDCDSVTQKNVNGYTIYTTYASNTPYVKAECWVKDKNEIKEVRYYLKESDFLYERIVYTSLPFEQFAGKAEFSNYIDIKDDRYIPTPKYKMYEIAVGK
ncbi:MAG: hypothetical protein U0T77_08465 [Chitinophagales bacterium]